MVDCFSDEAVLKYPRDSGWMLSSAYLVFFMQAGFAMLEAGSSKARDSFKWRCPRP